MNCYAIRLSQMMFARVPDKCRFVQIYRAGKGQFFHVMLYPPGWFVHGTGRVGRTPGWDGVCKFGMGERRKS